MRSQYGEWKVDMGSTPNQQAIYNWYMLAKRNSVSLNISGPFLGNYHVQLANSKWTQWWFCGIFVLFCIFPLGNGAFFVFLPVLILVLMFLWMFCFLFLFMFNFIFRERKHKVGWVRKWEGSGRSWKRRKTWS